MPGHTVDVANHEVAVGLMADYGGLLYESAHLLAAVAQAEQAARADEFEVLVAIEIESVGTHFELIQELTSSDASIATSAQEHALKLVASMHAIFGRFFRTGATLVASSAPALAEAVIHHARLVEGASKALAVALETQQDPAEIERRVWAVEMGVDEMDRVLAGLSRSEGASPDRPVTDGSHSQESTGNSGAAAGMWSAR